MKTISIEKAIEIVNSEQELEGEPPAEIKELFNKIVIDCDFDSFIKSLRSIVKITKRNIAENLAKHNP